MQKAARRIVEKLRLHGYEAFFAGGWVRDHILRRKPNDIDIATSARPEEVLRLFPNSTFVGAQFGVVQVRAYGRNYEVATFRKEGAYLDGRHPSSVTFSGPEEDAQRRDFTVNGLFYDPIGDRVIDYVHGRADLQHRLLQTIGNPDQRFTEDKLRLLRAVRLACSLGFEIAAPTWEAIRRRSADITQVSWERIRDELLKIITGNERARGMDLLVDSGLMKHIIPEVEAMRGVDQPPEYHPEGDVYTHTRMAVDLLEKPSPVLGLGTLLHDVGKPPTYSVQERIRFDGHVEVGARMAEDICRRLRLSNTETDDVVDLVLNHLRFLHVKEMRESTLRRFLSKPNFHDHLELHRVDCLSSHRKLESYHFCLQKLEQWSHEPAPVAPLIGGRDLIELGYPPGPLFSQILESVEDLQLENELHTREEALEYVKRSFPVPGKA
jgi:poly(A) polymerase